ncbi:N-acetylmuramoyl-L-alanine amidase [Mesotoga prima]|uniref:N-acetylmuramoyl-L-alanine amidase n=1 Tax=Mesotoga prima TaxID=1184387 RepID=UPI002C85C61A|nr:N-acetylmuramoyl-L-alanine amidase [Mesotoga prima]HNS76870.1 N-acetylmuramoyl-L-alanine amidase [Mesotoga prima]
MHFRYYGSNIGRFMKPDNVTGSPLNPQNWNLYSYVRGNPVNMNDPTGHEGEDSDKKKAKKKKATIDPGHGDQPNKWNDPGVVNGKVYEKDISLAIAKAISNALKKKGIEATLTREGDVAPKDSTPKLTWRVNKAKEAGSDVFVSIHVNTSLENPKPTTASGMKVFYSGEDSKDLADAIIAKQSTMPTSGTEERGFQVLRESAKAGIPAALVEVGFINNAADLKLMQTQSEQIGSEIADGIESFMSKSP